jgi:hypothetical protein
MDDALFSGLISTMGTIGKSLFKQDIATISFGMGTHSSYIVVISRELFAIQKQILFVFMYSQNLDVKMLRQLTTTIFMELKNSFREDLPKQENLEPTIERIINTKFNGLKDW